VAIRKLTGKERPRMLRGQKVEEKNMQDPSGGRTATSKRRERVAYEEE